MSYDQINHIYLQLWYVQDYEIPHKKLNMFTSNFTKAAKTTYTLTMNQSITINNKQKYVINVTHHTKNKHRLPFMYTNTFIL